MTSYFKNFRILSVLLFLFSVQTYTQSLLWEKTYGSPGDDGAQGMVITGDGNTVMTGFTSVSGVSEVLLMKTDPDGNVIWNKSLNLGFDNSGVGTIARDIKQTFDGGFIITGRLIDQVAFLIKTDSAGNVQWDETYHYPVGADDRGHEVHQTLDSGYIVAGQTWIMNGPFGSYDFFLFKTDKNGNTEWMKIFSFTDYGNDVALGVDQLPGGGYIVAGFTQSTTWASFVIRTDGLGNEVWRNIYEGPWQSECNDIEVTPDGGFIMTGLDSDFDTDTDVMLTKLDSAGNVMWKKIYSSPGKIAESGESIQQLSDGYLIGGMTTAKFDSWNMYVIRTDLNGDTVWARILGSDGDDRGFAAAKDGNFIYCSGSTWSTGQGMGDIYLIKLEDNAPQIGIINTGIEAKIYALSQNYPNPFNPETKINFALSKASLTSLKIFDVTGRQVAELLNQRLNAGSYSYTFNGAGLPSGVYFYTLDAGGFRETKKMLLVK